MAFAYGLLCSHPKPRSDSIFSRTCCKQHPLVCCSHEDSCDPPQDEEVLEPLESPEACLSRSYLPLILLNLGVGEQRIKYKFLLCYLVAFTKQLFLSSGFPAVYALLSVVKKQNKTLLSDK